MPNQQDTDDASTETKDASKVKGALARADSLSPKARSGIARRAALARWDAGLPKALVDGQISIAGRIIDCAVLENGKRVLTQESFLTAIGRSSRPKAGTGILLDGMPSFLAAENLNPFITDELRESTTPLAYLTLSGRKAYGYDALLLPMVCEVYLKARDKDALHYTQKNVVIICDLLTRGLARVGITALIDEATGYEELKDKRELNRILEAYIAPELRPYMPMFPHEFFKQVYRIHGWNYKGEGATQSPRYVGKFINKYVYDQLPPGVLPEIQKRNPVVETGRRRYKNSQFLTGETGIPALDKQVANVTVLMRIAENKQQFSDFFERAYAEYYQRRLPLVIDVTPEQEDPEK